MAEYCGYKKINCDDQTILNLNDDCLYEIFSYLTIDNLCRIGTTCIRLNRIAQKFYSYCTTLDGWRLLQFESETTEMMLQEIGDHVKSVEIGVLDSKDVQYESIMKLNLVLKYCPNLSELILTPVLDDYFSDDKLREMFKSPVFQNLQSIILHCDLIDSLEILGSMKHLKQLYFSTSNTKIKGTDFLKLRNLDSLILDLPEPLDYDIYSGIFDNNLELKYFYLGDWGIDDRILNLICDKLICLKRLNFPYNRSIISDRAILRIAELKNLTHFNPYWPKFLLEKLAEVDSLESLSYYFENPGEFITKFTKLKRLDAYGLDDAILNSLKSQSVLEVLDITFKNSITANGLVKFIEGAKNLKRLTQYNLGPSIIFPVKQKYRNLIIDNY